MEMPQAYCVKIVVATLTLGLKFVIPTITVLVAAHFNPAQLGSLVAQPLGWGKNP